jgi:nucleotide-binding universal stress UspA family protein
MVERILVPLDGSPLAERALPYAVRLASATGARLVLMHGQAALAIRKEPDFDVAAFASRLEQGEAGVPLAALAGVEIDAVTHNVYLDKIAEGICETVVDRRADLVVMSTHGHSGFGRWLYGSVADQVLRQSSVPVMLVPATCDHAWSDTAALRILVPLDGSAFAEEALEPIGALATILKAELVLVGASGPFDYAYAEGVPYVRTGFDAALQETRTYLDSVAARLRAAGQTVAVDAETGRAGPVIEGIARRRHVDLIALATHGRSGVARLALGSVAAEILHRSTVPLLLWRPASLRHAAEPEAAATSAP